jgi:hypothetical protein
MSGVRMMAMFQNKKKKATDDAEEFIPLLSDEDRKLSRPSRPMLMVEEAKKPVAKPKQPPASVVQVKIEKPPVAVTENKSRVPFRNEEEDEIDPVSGAKLTVMRWMNMYGNQFKFNLGISLPANLGSGMPQQPPTAKK